MATLDRFLSKVLKEDVLNEMGGAAMEADRIKKEHIKPTLDRYAQDVLNNIPHRKFIILGSAGKKADSGDIDLGFDTKLSIQEVADYLDDLNILYKVGKGFDQIWTSFTQYDEEGNPVTDENGREKTVQIDLMFGDPDWLEFAYWSPSQEETDYSAHHRSVLLAAIIRFAEEKELEDGAIQTHVINWGSGVWTKKRVKYVATKGKYAGQEREKQIKSERPLITTPQGVADFLSDATGKKWTVGDLRKPFEDLWKKAASVFDAKTMTHIAEYVKPAIEHRGPTYVVPQVVKNLVKEDVSLNKKIIKKLSKEL